MGIPDPQESDVDPQPWFSTNPAPVSHKDTFFDSFLDFFHVSAGVFVNCL
jgi:hypothetical protein